MIKSELFRSEPDSNYICRQTRVEKLLRPSRQ
ncbi:MAG: hypothetical protein QOC89_4123 [Paraburkholderia sp.]|nr:hypothetical protein [Paraburkholderia sp.]